MNRTQTMRPYLIASVLMMIFISGMTQDELTVNLDRSGEKLDLKTYQSHSGKTMFFSIKSPAKVSISQGFTDPDFGFEINLDPNEKDGSMQIQSLFDRTLQYTLSNMEGKILFKRIFVKEDQFDMNKLVPGSYPIYFFRGKRIVKALLLDIS